MANLVGPVLSRLVRERAYCSGELHKVGYRQDIIRRELAALIREYRFLTDIRKEKEARVAEIDKKIKEHADFDPDEIRPIRSAPRRYVSRHGTFRPAIIKFLKDQLEPDLHHLSCLPVDELKVDHAVIRSLHPETDGGSAVDLTVAMGTNRSNIASGCVFSAFESALRPVS